MSHFKFIVTIIFIVFGAFECKPPKKCTIVIDKLNAKQPIILHKNINDGFVYPNNNKRNSIILKAGDEIRLVCPGSHLGAMPYADSSIFKCIDNDIFLFNKQKFPVHDIMCKAYPDYRLYTNGPMCGNGVGMEGDIGFEIMSNQNQEYYPLLKFCHDKSSHYTLYVHTRLMAGLRLIKKKTWTHGKSFVKDDLYKNIPLDNIYTKQTQLRTFYEILRDPDLAKKYISETKGTNYLAKGHLIAKSYFLYEPLKRATFYYVNSLPMWQAVNNGNWACVERAIKSYIAESANDHDILAGGKDLFQLWDKNSQLVNMYLHYADNGQMVHIGIPRLIYKILYNRNAKSGIVFIVVNDPFLTQISPNYHIICNDVSSRLTGRFWKELDTKKTKLANGYAYACDVNEFKSKFPPNYFPAYLNVQSLLT